MNFVKDIITQVDFNGNNNPIHVYEGSEEGGSYNSRSIPIADLQNGELTIIQ